MIAGETEELYDLESDPEELHNLVAVPEHKKRVLKNLNVEIEKGRVLALLGPNGAGKSTLFKIIGGLLKCTEGEALVFEQNASTCHLYS